MRLIFNEYLIIFCGDSALRRQQGGSLKAPLPHVNNVLAHFSIYDVVALNT